MANTTNSLSFSKFNELVATTTNSSLRQALLAKGSEGRITGLQISLRKGDQIIVAPGAEPQLFTVTGKPVIVNNSVATDAYWAFIATIHRGGGIINDVTIPVSSFCRLGKEFPGLGPEFVREGRTLPNRSGFEFLQDLLEEFPVSAALYRAQTDWARAQSLYGEGEGFSLTVEEVREGYTLPYKTKASREELEAAGRKWGDDPHDWRKISMLFVSMERNSNRGGTRTSNRGAGQRRREQGA